MAGKQMRDLDEILDEIRRTDPERYRRIQARTDYLRVLHDICEARRRQGLAQAELAEKAGVSVSAIARMERAESSPQWETVKKLAEALGVRVMRKAEAG